jgi:beta-1,4-mannosyltransferase
MLSDVTPGTQSSRHRTSRAGDPHYCVLKVLASPYIESVEQNPVQALLYRSMEKLGVHVRSFSTRELLSGKWDIWHLHWPENIVGSGTTREAIFRLIKFWIQLKIARTWKTKVFWTVHNLRPHARHRPILEKIFWWAFIPNIDGTISMSESGRALLHEQHMGTKVHPTFIIPHGHYRDAYHNSISREEARRALQINGDELVIAFIGHISPYKGVSRLIKIFKELNLKNSKLIIAGQPNSSSLARHLQDIASNDDRIGFYFEFISSDDIQKFMGATDLIVLPYLEILNSGSAMLALSFNRPVLVPAQGALKELSTTVGSEWIHLYHGELSSETLGDAIRWTKQHQSFVQRVAPLEELSWDRIAALTVQAFLYFSRHTSNRIEQTHGSIS